VVRITIYDFKPSNCELVALGEFCSSGGILNYEIQRIKCHIILKFFKNHGSMSPIWTNRWLPGWVVLDFKEKILIFFLSNPSGWILIGLGNGLAKTNTIWLVYTPSQWLPLCYNTMWKVIILLYNLYASIVQLSDLPEIDCLLITQSLDDHCHLKTLNPFSQKFPNTRVIATPNAKSLLDPLFNNVSIYVLSIFSLPHCCWKLYLCTLCIWIWMI
jgi:hypothetical protein